MPLSLLKAGHAICRPLRLPRPGAWQLDLVTLGHL
ncbi:hypothetical protein BCO18430_03364 [Burkholderia contaminans]|nr:hypothetical protein BCO18430_03364 [Burkholderia contaminans]